MIVAILKQSARWIEYAMHSMHTIYSNVCVLQSRRKMFKMCIEVQHKMHRKQRHPYSNTCALCIFAIAIESFNEW